MSISEGTSQGVDLTGSTALVTGASSGLGRRFAVAIASHGARVAVTGRRVDRLESLVSEIRASGGTAMAIGLDVRDADEIVAAIDHAERQLGLISILVNNAGIPDAQYAAKMSVDLIDTCSTPTSARPFSVAARWPGGSSHARIPGRIVNISSIRAVQLHRRRRRAVLGHQGGRQPA